MNERRRRKGRRRKRETDKLVRSCQKREEKVHDTILTERSLLFFFVFLKSAL